VLFLTYVEPVVVPTLKPGDIVVLDNLGSHNGKAVWQGIRPAPCTATLSLSLQSSRPCCERRSSDLSTPLGSALARPSKPSPKPNVPTTSPTGIRFCSS
jgi:transposase